MANPTLDEIEAGLDVVEPYLTHDYQRSLLALVAHVRALQEHAAQSKALEEALLLGKDALFAAQAREQKLAEENAELRKLAQKHCGICHGQGTYMGGCGRCGDSTEDHVCNDVETPCPQCLLVNAVSGGVLPDAQWPTPQPIETAPLGDILAGPAPNGFAWAPERPLAGCSLESWRAQLREAERRWWLPMPPPGGGK